MGIRVYFVTKVIFFFSLCLLDSCGTLLPFVLKVPPHCLGRFTPKTCPTVLSTPTYADVSGQKFGRYSAKI